MIEIDDLTVAFGGLVALDSVTVTLTRNVCGIIGPNGAGKTTFLNVFSGFILPRKGSIRMFGADVLAMRPYQRARWGLRRSFQQEQVVDELTVEDNVRVVLDPLGLAAGQREAALDAALEFVGLRELRCAPAAGLNAYERRMTELARTVIGSPRVLMLDEPGAGLSQVETERLRAVIAAIHGFNGAVTLLIDHDVDLIQAVCEETMVLDFGSLIAVGETGAVLTDPKVRAVYLGVDEVEP